MENIFKNAYFGKAYKTRDGRKAIYIYYGSDIQNPFINYHHLICEGSNKIERMDYKEIVSEWQEEINEEELDKLSYDYCPEERTWATVNGYKERDAFRAGYRKAKEK